MKIRQLLDDKKRKIVLMLWLGIVLFFFGATLSAVFGSRGPIAVLIAIMMCLAMAEIFIVMRHIHYKGIPCPKCNKAWGFMALNSGGIFSIPKKIKNCPFCGIDIDSELN